MTYISSPLLLVVGGGVILKETTHTKRTSEDEGDQLTLFGFCNDSTLFCQKKSSNSITKPLALFLKSIKQRVKMRETKLSLIY